VFTLMSSNGARHEVGGTRTLVGGMSLGWGLFNTVEGVVNHHLLELHHVRPGPDEFVYDVGFLAWGVAMLVIGAVLVRAVAPERADT
jgi:uncharacterized membrane protein